MLVITLVQERNAYFVKNKKRKRKRQKEKNKKDSNFGTVSKKLRTENMSETSRKTPKVTSSVVESWTKKQLLQLCRRRCWRGYSKLRKTDLVHFITVHDFTERRAARVICDAVQKWLLKIRSYEIVNETDFCTLEPFDEEEEEEEEKEKEKKEDRRRNIDVRISSLTSVVRRQRRPRRRLLSNSSSSSPSSSSSSLRPERFVLRQNGKAYQFNPRTFLQYILSSGSFTNPFTRTVLSDIDLRRLQGSFLRSRRRSLKNKPNQVPPPLTFEFKGTNCVLDGQVDLIRIRRFLERERKEQRDREELTESIRRNCVRIHDFLIELICTFGEPTGNERDSDSTVQEVIGHIRYYHIPHMRSWLQNYYDLDPSGCYQTIEEFEQNLFRIADEDRRYDNIFCQYGIALRSLKILFPEP